MRRVVMAAALMAVMEMVLGTGTAIAEQPQGNDRHVGYYYPAPGQIEIYTARAPQLPQANRTRRIGFVVGIVKQMGEKPYPPGLSIFAKGAQAEKLIMVANRDGLLDTVFRIRGMLATLTSAARTTPIFNQLQVQDSFTFLDLLKLLGFEQLTVTDGVAFTHQIKLRDPVPANALTREEKSTVQPNGSAFRSQLEPTSTID